MQKIIGASCVFVCDWDFSIISDGGVLFECDQDSQTNQILEIGEFENLKAKYPQCKAEFYPDCVLLPALSNAHIHFEFSNNQSHLLYGDFPSWLGSVIAHREELFASLEESIQREINLQLASGIASVGAISSHGYDIALLANSPLRVTLFNEGIGSAPEALDFLYGNLLERLSECEKLKSYKFTPALAIHSPYSTHAILAKKIATLAREKNLKLSCHFLESKEEQEWLSEGKGWFAEFFASFFGNANAKPSINADEFIKLLEGLNPLFVHCLFADSDILDKIARIGGAIISAPRSNRLLNNRYLDLKMLKNANLNPIFSTDGLSSNCSLNLIEEIRSAFFGYAGFEVNTLAQDLILGITHFPALALGNANGEIKEGKNADFALFECKGIAHSSQKPLHFILHAKSECQKLYVNGKGEYCGKN